VVHWIIGDLCGGELFLFQEKRKLGQLRDPSVQTPFFKENLEKKIKTPFFPRRSLISPTFLHQ
jgi:hypothetical protein